tara:strand:+ start:153 stop:281 length:129 start_codon:yes stop_codon:yes gene_type:complete
MTKLKKSARSSRKKTEAKDMEVKTLLRELPRVWEKILIKITT